MKDWIVEIRFSVGSKGKKVWGDGFAFWFTEEDFSEGAAFGRNPKFTGLGIFFDTFQNKKSSTKFPYISAMVNDGTKTYKHHDDGVSTSIGGCSVDFRNAEHPTRAKISYISKNLQVFTDIDGEDNWSLCFQVPDVDLITEGFLGFSAATGQAHDIHKLLSVTTVQVNPISGKSYLNVKKTNLRIILI